MRRRLALARHPAHPESPMKMDETRCPYGLAALSLSRMG
jgi:hypothetical protein